MRNIFPMGSQNQTVRKQWKLNRDEQFRHRTDKHARSIGREITEYAQNNADTQFLTPPLSFYHEIATPRSRNLELAAAGNKGIDRQKLQVEIEESEENRVLRK